MTRFTRQAPARTTSIWAPPISRHSQPAIGARSGSLISMKPHAGSYSAVEFYQSWLEMGARARAGWRCSGGALLHTAVARCAGRSVSWTGYDGSDPDRWTDGLLSPSIPTSATG